MAIWVKRKDIYYFSQFQVYVVSARRCTVFINIYTRQSWNGSLGLLIVNGRQFIIIIINIERLQRIIIAAYELCELSIET